MHNRISKAILTFTAAGMTLIHAGAALQANDMEHMLFDPVPADRLPSVEVRKLYQDEEGFIWIPTYDGIARYDGYDTVIYRISSDGDGHSVSNRMNTLCEYEDSVLLVGSELGLLTLDKKTGKLSKPSTGPTDECNISSIVISKDYGIFIGADKGLFVMKPETGRSVRIDLRDYEGKPVERRFIQTVSGRLYPDQGTCGENGFGRQLMGRDMGGRTGEGPQSGFR